MGLQLHARPRVHLAYKPIFPQLQDLPVHTGRDVVSNVGAQKAIEDLFEKLEWQQSDAIAWLVRVLGYVVFILVLTFEFAFNEIGAPPKRLAVWLLCYLVSLLVLENWKYAWPASYDLPASRLCRITLYLSYFTCLTAIAHHGNALVWLFYVIPLSAIVSYFRKPSWFAFLYIETIGAYYLGSVVFSDQPLQIWQFFTIAAILSFFALSLRYITDPARLVPGKLNHIANELNATVDLHDLASQLVALAHTLTSADRTLLVVVDPGTGHCLVYAGNDFVLAAGKSLEEFVAKCIVFQNGKPFDCSSMSSSYDGRSIYATYFDCAPESVLAYPIYGDSGTLIGTLTVAGNNQGHFDATARRALRELCKVSPKAILNAVRMHHADKQKTQQQIAERLSDAASVDEAYRVIIDSAIKLVPSADTVALLVPAPSGSLTHVMTLRAALPGQREVVTDSAVPDSVYAMAEQVFREQRPLLISNLKRVRDVALLPDSVRCLLVVPICLPGPDEAIAVLTLLSPRAAAFAGTDLLAIQNLCNAAAGIVSNLRAFALFKAHGGKMKTIFDEALSFDAIVDERSLCSQIAVSAARVLEFRLARLWLVDLKTNEWLTVAMAEAGGKSITQAVGMRAPQVAFQVLMSREFRMERSFFVSDDSPIWERVDLSLFWSRSVETPPRHVGGRSWQHNDALFTPILSRSGRVIGLLSLDGPLNGLRPSRESIEAIGVFADAAGWAVEKARTIERLREQRVRTQALLLSINKELRRCTDVRAIGNVVVQIAKQLFPVEGCTLHVWKDGSLELTHSSYPAGGARVSICDIPKTVAVEKSPRRCWPLQGGQSLPCHDSIRTQTCSCTSVLSDKYVA